MLVCTFVTSVFLLLVSCTNLIYYRTLGLAVTYIVIPRFCRFVIGIIEFAVTNPSRKNFKTLDDCITVHPRA